MSRNKHDGHECDYDNNFTRIDLDSVEDVIEETTGNEQEKQEDNVVFVQEPAIEDKPKPKKRARKQKVTEIKLEPKEPDTDRPERVHPNHWRIAMANARRPFERGED